LRLAHALIARTASCSLGKRGNGSKIGRETIK
jgi:hypothetical protein